jgi:pimeloyl-ACP methyl ester carboxylesterase/DNA-binding CsgD family transcriptional regulator
MVRKTGGSESKAKGSVPPDDNQIIDAIYDFAIDIDTWLSFLNRLSTLFPVTAAGPEGAQDPFIERHLGRAQHIAENLNPEGSERDSMDLNSGLPIASVALSKEGKILGLNRLAHALLTRFCNSLEVGTLITFENDQSTSMLYERLTDLSDFRQQYGPQLFQLVDERDGTSHVCCLVRLRDVPPQMGQGIASQLDLDLSDQYLLIAFQRDREQQDEVLSRTFGLTPAESRLALLLADGRSLEDSADLLGVSIHTVRAQLKSAFAKTGTNRQQDLVRIIAELESLWEHAYALVNWQNSDVKVPAQSNKTRAQVTDTANVPPYQFLSRPDGRRLAYRLYGPPNGIKVLFFHAMIGSSLMPADIIKDAHQRGLCLICPERPGVGLSSDQGDRTYESVARDFKALVDTLGGGPCKLLSHASGAAYGMAYASLFPDESEALVLAGPRPGKLFPAADQSGFSIRSYLRASSVRPWVLTAFIDLSRKRLNDRFLEQVLRRYYRDSKADMAALSRPEVLSYMIRGSAESLALSSQGARLDTELMAAAIPVDPAHLNLPLLVWSGLQDQAIDQEATKALFERAPDARLRTSQDMGQLLFPLRWGEMIDWLLTIRSG